MNRFIKVREEADPFSMDLGSVKKGDVVKVLEVRMAGMVYLGRVARCCRSSS